MSSRFGVRTSVHTAGLILTLLVRRLAVSS